MKTLLLSTFLLLLFACGQNTTLPPQIQPNHYAKQIGLCDIDTTSFWEYQVYAIASTNDTSAYTITYTVIDTATINGQSAYLIRNQTPYGSTTFKQRTDSTGVYMQGSGAVSHYPYPVTNNSTFLLYSSNGCDLYSTVLSADTTITIHNHTFTHCIAYYNHAISGCNNTNTIVFYQYGIGMVVTQIITPSATTEWFLLQWE